MTGYFMPEAIQEAVLHSSRHGSRHCSRHCLAYSQVTGDLKTFSHPLGGELLYHSTRWGQTLAVGDPLACPTEIEPLLGHFLNSHPQADFLQCSSETAQLLEARGFFVNSFGVETDLVLNRWSPSGKRAHMLRKNFNKAARLGVEVVEITDNREQLETARRVSDSWLLATKQISHELRMLTRPPVFAPEEGTRKFASYYKGEMVGIGFFDPLCIDKPGLGYVYQLLRDSPDAPTATGTHLLLSVAEEFRAAGIERLSLGLSPNSLAEKEIFRHSRWIRGVLQISRKWPWYNFEGQEFFKSRFGGDEKTVFVASRSKFALSLLFNLAVETGMARTYWGRFLGRM